jgi:REP element-mobilizing transposase RayT
MAKFKRKYRIESIRAQWCDYGWNGAYFITICTNNRRHFFGEIRNGKIFLSPLGAIADLLWHEIPYHSKFVSVGEFVVMPNHIQGILLIDKPDGDNGAGNVAGNGAVTRHANRLQIENGWQTGFHDHIIRSRNAYERIENYIVQNPQNWKYDTFHN